MQTPRIDRTLTEYQYAVCRNSEAAVDMADGQVVVWDVTTTAGRIQGKDVILSTGASQLTVAGVVVGVIKNLEYGLVQVFGFHPNVKTTVAALAAGLTVNSDAAGAAVAAAVYGAYLGVSLKLGAANRAGIMIKTMGG